jgi:hypothetical protein
VAPRRDLLAREEDVRISMRYATQAKEVAAVERASKPPVVHRHIYRRGQQSRSVTNVVQRTGFAIRMGPFRFW